MIVPQNRLLLWILLLAFPVSLLGALGPAAALSAEFAIGGFLFVCILDAALALGRLDGYSVEYPEVVRLSKDQQGMISLKISNESTAAGVLVLGVPLPFEIRSPNETMSIQAPPPGTSVFLDWPVCPLKRGNYRFADCFLEAASTLGFWAIRRKVQAPGEVRVYPNLLEERKNLASLFLNRGNVGIHTLRQIGKGHEFEKLREYVPGDSYDDIHWKATAKRGRPITKVFQIERTQEVFVVIDSSRLSAREIQGKRLGTAQEIESNENPSVTDPFSIVTLLDRSIRSGLILKMVAEKQGDRFGLITFSDRVENFIPAGNGKAHYGRCRDALYTLEPQRVAPDFDELFRFIRLRLHRRALLVFLTNLDDASLAESFMRRIDLVSRRHVLLVNMISPPLAKPLFTDSEIAATDEIYQSLGGHLQWENLRKLKSALHVKGVDFNLLSSEMMTPQLVAQYLNVKQRQLL